MIIMEIAVLPINASQLFARTPRVITRVIDFGELHAINCQGSQTNEFQIAERLRRILTLPNSIVSMERLLYQEFNFICDVIENHPGIINTIHIDCDRWNNVTSFMLLMIYLNTNTSINLMYYAHECGYPVDPTYTIVDDKGDIIEVDILATYLRENPPISRTPYREDVVRFLISCGSDLTNSNYRGVDSKTMLELYNSGVDAIDYIE